MPKAIKKKTVKKHAINETTTRSFISKSMEYFSDNNKIFILISVGAVLVIFLIAGIFLYNRISSNKAEKLGEEAFKTYYGITNRQPVSREARFIKAGELFKKSYEAKKSPVALFYMAACYYEMGKYDDAVKMLDELNKKYPDDEMFVPLTYYKLALISLKKDDKAESLRYLDILSKYKTTSYKDLALIEAGKILESMGRTADAKKKYEELIKDYPQSPFAEEARLKAAKK
ncbi:MAG: tetratricopeptide repeat protein [Nitrospiraceae bacterium]|nr:tetratricopeptide repeat protein [Nitrospiraceae bacterium]